MVSSAANSVAAYLAELPAERRAVVSAVRDMINANLPPGYEEGMAYGMIGWCIPLSRYPVTYNKQPLSYVALAAQKNNYALYLTCAYVDAAQDKALRDAYAQAGRKLDMGKSCLRFKSLDDLLMAPVANVVAATSVEQFIAGYEAARKLT